MLLAVRPHSRLSRSVGALCLAQGSSDDWPENHFMLTDADLPALFKAADKASLKGQKSAVRRTSAYLALLVLAALGGAMSWTVDDGNLSVGGLLSVLAFTASLFVGFTIVHLRPEERWYRGRAAAESVKTLAWRYAVGGDPFGIDAPEAEVLFTRRLRDLVEALRDIGLPAVDGTEQISNRMRTIRTSSLEERRMSYLQGRIEDQCSWYTRKARINDRRGRGWAIASGFLILAGLSAGLARAFTVLETDLLGVLAAAAAAAAAWAQMRQHRTLASSYGLAAQELGLTRAVVGEVSEELEWSRAVSDAEDAISREHTTWLARRSRAGGAVTLPFE
jgi:hypothetical protein